VRLPIRLRLTLAFASSMALLLAVGGAFLYVRLGAELLRTTDAALSAQAGTVAAGIGQQNTSFADQTGNSAQGFGVFAQILDANGRVVEASDSVASAPLVSLTDLSSVSGPTFITRTVKGVDGPSRTLLVPVSEAGERNYVLVGTSLASRHEVLSRFLFVLLLGGPLALLATSAAGWTLAGAALKPVERMREEAAAISASEPSRRLPVTASGDEIARLGTTLNSMLDQLQAAMERERRFVADASHELRTPLAILKTELDIALARSRTPRELQSALRSAAEETDRLAALAEDLLVYSGSEGGRVPLHRTETRLDSLLANAGARFAVRAKDSAVRLRVDASAQAAHVDAARVRQAVDNLIDNALAHTPPGGDIDVRAARDREWVRLIVEDSGPGFPPDFVGRALEPFARGGSERAERRTGAGLGLAIVRAVAEAHGGHATAENRREGGARITVVLRDSDEERREALQLPPNGPA